MQHKVIYHLVEEIRRELVTRLPPIISEELVAKAKVLQIFTQSDGDKVYGLHIIQGIFSSKKNQDSLIYMTRNERVLGQVEVMSMRQEKHAVQEVGQDMQCGVMLKKINTKEKVVGEELEEEQQTGVAWEVKENDELRMYKRVTREAIL